MNNKESVGKRLEQYTLKRPQEVLIVEVVSDNEPDQILIFKGVSSSLMKPTNFDPDVPVLPHNATIVSIDRLKSPYKPTSANYIQQGLSWSQMAELLAELNV